MQNVVDIALRYATLFISGSKNTLIIALSATIIGLFIGLLMGLVRSTKVDTKDSILQKSTKKLLQLLSTLYIEIFRGTPMMVQAIFIYYTFLPLFRNSKLLAGIVIVSINTGAYMAEIIRAGIQSLDKGQNEAARSLGLSNRQTMILVILPQAIKNAFPSIGNEFVVNIKDTSVLNVIGVTELYFQSVSVAGINYRFVDTFTVTALIYLFLTYSTTSLLKWLEKRYNIEGYDGVSSSTMPMFRKETKA